MGAFNEHAKNYLAALDMSEDDVQAKREKQHEVNRWADMMLLVLENPHSTWVATTIGGVAYEFIADDQMGHGTPATRISYRAV